MAVFLGMRGSGDFTVTGQRPENWRQMILKLYPNGKAPLTAIMSMLASEKTDDPIFHWFEKDFQYDQRVTVTGVHQAASLDNAWVAADGELAAGTSVYIQMAAASLDYIKVGHVIMLAHADSSTARIKLLVTAKTANGASSYLTCKLLHAFTMGTTVPNVAIIIGTAYPEGDTSGTSILYDPTEASNYTQIFRNSLENTRTAAKTRLRTGDAIAQAKAEALELHSIEMEKAFIFGTKYATTGTNGKPLRFTGGIKSFIPAANVCDYRLETGAATWTAAGKSWLDEKLRALFRWGSENKIAFCGDGAVLGLNRLVEANSTYQISKGESSYGISVWEFMTPFGKLTFKTHPLFSIEPTLEYSAMIVDTKFLKYRFIDDTKYLPNRQANDLDGEKSEYLTEAGLEVHFGKTHMWLDGLGQDNPAD